MPSKTHSPQGPGRLIGSRRAKQATEAVATGIALRLVAIRSILTASFILAPRFLFAVPSASALLKNVRSVEICFAKWMRGGTRQFDSVSRSCELFQCHEPRAPHIDG